MTLPWQQLRDIYVQFEQNHRFDNLVIDTVSASMSSAMLMFADHYTARPKERAGEPIGGWTRPPDVELVPTCCEDPKPRISETTGRLFCGSCRRYLSAAPEPLSDEAKGAVE